MSNRVNDLAVYKKLVSAEACKLDRIYGHFEGTGDAYLAVFDQKDDTIAADAVPKVAAMRIYAATGFDIPYYGLEFEYGCVLAFIDLAAYDADATVTVCQTTEQGSITAEGEGFETTAITTLVGDLTSGVDSQVITATGQVLMSIKVVSAAAADTFLNISPSSDGSVAPLLTVNVPAGETVTLNFGLGGFYAERNLSDLVAFMSTDTTVANITTSGEFNIQALVK